MTIFTILIYCTRIRVSSIYYKRFDKHRCFIPIGSIYAFCISHLKEKAQNVIDQRSWYIYTNVRVYLYIYSWWVELIINTHEGKDKHSYLYLFFMVSTVGLSKPYRPLHAVYTCVMKVVCIYRRSPIVNIEFSNTISDCS